MTQIHVVIRRINPALKIDLAQIGRFEDRQFEPLPLSVVAGTPIESYLNSSHISDSLYVNHSEVPGLVSACESLPGFCIDFFDNTLVLMFDLNLDHDESTSKEEGKGN